MPRCASVGYVLSLLLVVGCSGANRSQLDCPRGRTELDGVCVSDAIADYVSCVRAQGAALAQKDAQKLSADAGYAGAKASVVSDVSASLAKSYSLSDANTLEIIRTCKTMQDRNVSGAPSPSAPGWVRQGPFGAIAISDTTEDFGWAIERASAAEAKAAALANCPQKDCYEVVALQSACGAAVKGGDGVEYWSNHHPSRADAETRAIQECQAKTTDCKLVVWTCSF